MTDDAQQAFGAEHAQHMREWAQKKRNQERNNATKRAMRYICSISGVDMQEVMRNCGDADPMSVLCDGYLQPTPYGKIGLYVPDLVPAKAFSMFYIKPKKATERLEQQLEEAMCIYPAEKFPIVGVLFLSADKKMFVYCNSGVVDQTSVMVLRFMRRTRFIYSLDGFCKALGLWQRDDAADED